MGLSSLQPLLDESVGRQVAQLEGIAAEFLDEAAELSMRAQLAQDEVGGSAAPPAATDAAAGSPGSVASPTTPAEPEQQRGWLGRIVDAITPDDDRKA